MGHTQHAAERDSDEQQQNHLDSHALQVD